jgi:dienelactone hydrolase
VSREDSLAAFEYIRRLPFVDPKSIVIYGCSGGGDLALEVAAATTEPCAIVPEEPASFIFAGIFNAESPKRGERFVPDDSLPIGKNPRGFYTIEFQKLTRAKIARIHCPILIIQGDQDPRVFPSTVRFSFRSFGQWERRSKSLHIRESRIVLTSTAMGRALRTLGQR